jgi:hypothetical protein
MSLLDKAKAAFGGAKDKAADLARDHGDAITGTIDKAGDLVDKRTRGRYADRIGTARSKAKEAVGKLAGETGPGPGGTAEAEPREAGGAGPGGGTADEAGGAASEGVGEGAGPSTGGTTDARSGTGEPPTGDGGAGGDAAPGTPGTTDPGAGDPGSPA